MSTSKNGLWALLRKLDITLKRHQKIWNLKRQSYRTFFSLIAKRDPKSAHKPQTGYQQTQLNQ